MADNYGKAIEELFNQGPLSPAWDYAKPGVVIEMAIQESEGNETSIYSIEKEMDGRATVREGKAEEPDARCSMTDGALEHLKQAEDYLEAGRRIYEMRAYPTPELSMHWQTLISAVDAYEKIFIFYRKLAMN